MDFVVLMEVLDECRVHVEDLVAERKLQSWQPPGGVACRVSSVQDAIEIARVAKDTVGDALTSVLLNGTRLDVEPPALSGPQAVRRGPNDLIAALAEMIKDGNEDQVRAVYGPVVLEKLRAVAAAGDAATAGATSAAAKDILNAVRHDSRKRTGVVLARTQL